MLNPETAFNRRVVDRIARSSVLASVSNVMQPVVVNLLSRTGRGLADALHGTWLGHPLHPLLTDVPVGAWTVTGVCDALELCGRTELAGGSDAALVVGLLGAAGAAVTGYADWSDTAGDPKTLGTAHALLNGAATGAYIGSFVARRVGKRRLGIGLALVGYGVMSFAAYLGGELSFGLGLGVKHTAFPIDPKDDYVPVLDDAQLPADRLVRADLGRVPLLLLRSDGVIRAIGAACTHRGAPLDEGTLEGACVRCPWHGSLFAFADGRALEGPASFPQPRFEARLHAGRIEVRPLTV